MMANCSSHCSVRVSPSSNARVSVGAALSRNLDRASVGDTERLVGMLDKRRLAGAKAAVYALAGGKINVGANIPACLISLPDLRR